ncbi:MAG TPA: O-antigen ligase family protein [Stellaceae bacterium]|nr:O-antigen ligase family protein [Stellaceae bacterium]
MPDLEKRPVIDALLFWLWLGAVLLSPVWFGANTPAIWGAHAIVFGLLLAACGMLRRPLAVPIRRLRVPLAALAVVALWAAVQSAVFAPAAWRHPLWRLASAALGKDIGGAISVYPGAGLVAILWMATAAAVFFLAVQHGRDPRRARLVLVATAVGGAAVAAYGLAIYLTGNKLVLWRPKHAYLDALSATFINRDTFAAYAGTVLTVAFGFIVGELGGLRPLRASGAVRAMALLLLGAIVALVSTALILAGSRAGTAVAVLGAGSVSVLAVARSRSWRGLLVAGFAAGGLAGIGFAAASGDLLTARLSWFARDLSARLALDRSVLEAITARPALGYGFGAFKEAYPPFRALALQQSGRWEYAHNSWLEALMTLGVPVGLLLWLIFLWVLARCLAGALRRGPDPIYPAIGAAVGMLAAAQSLIDFPVQIQGFAIPLLAILGVAVAQSWSSREVN